MPKYGAAACSNEKKGGIPKANVTGYNWILYKKRSIILDRVILLYKTCMLSKFQTRLIMRKCRSTSFQIPGIRLPKHLMTCATASVLTSYVFIERLNLRCSPIFHFPFLSFTMLNTSLCLLKYSVNLTQNKLKKKKTIENKWQHKRILKMW